MSTDDWVTKAIQHLVEDEKDWLCGSFQRVLDITRRRSSKQGYGFEWAIHTALACWLLRNPDIQELTIGEKCQDDLKADLSFSVRSQKVIIELKTTERGNMTFAAGDVKKPYSRHIAVYYLLFSYPYKSETPPALEGAQYICGGTGPCEFPYYLFKRV